MAQHIAAEPVDVVAPPQPVAFSRGYRAWLLLLLTLMSALNLADRQGLAAIAPAMKADLKLSDTQLGLMQGLAFALFFVALALPIARLADRRRRSLIIGISVATFSAFIFLCSRATSFTHILLGRLGVGAGDAGFVGPPVSSLIGDHYPPQRRTSAMTVVWIGAPAGAFAGASIGGWVAQNTDWRWWFAGLAVPAAVLALLVLVTMREPARGAFDPPGAGARKPPSMWNVMRFLGSKRSMMHVLIGVGLASSGMNGIGQFLARFFVSNFHLGMADTGKLLGGIGVVGMASGLALGGFGLNWLAQRDRRWLVWGSAIGLALTTPLFIAGAFTASSTSIILPVALLLIGHVTLFVYYTPSIALTQNMVDSSMRASAAFILTITLNLIGIGLGPTLVGFISDTMAAHSFALGDFAQLCPGGAAGPGATAGLAEACSAASRAGIAWAIALASLLFLWSAAHYWLAARHLEVDLDRAYAETD
ncbi:MAG: MFS transporter [Sphingobium sp.]|nr:MFS transporter [Sphingobium sp.]